MKHNFASPYVWVVDNVFRAINKKKYNLYASKYEWLELKAEKKND